MEKAKLSTEGSPRNGIEDAAFDGHLMLLEGIKNVGFVNNSTTVNLEARLSTAVNNSEKSEPEVPLQTVNSNEEGLGIQNHFEEKNDEFD